MITDSWKLWTIHYIWKSWHKYKLYTFILFLETKCEHGQAYHSGALLSDYTNVVDEKQCLEKCNAADSCRFWDFGVGWCRLRTNSGDGPQLDNKYSSGPKNCLFNMGNWNVDQK